MHFSAHHRRTLVSPGYPSSQSASLLSPHLILCHCVSTWRHSFVHVRELHFLLRDSTLPHLLPIQLVLFNFILFRFLFGSFYLACRTAPGTLITHTRDLSQVLLTSIVLKPNVTLIDVTSSRMVGQAGFLSKVFGVCGTRGVSVDVVATSEVSVSLTLDPTRLPSRLGSEADSKVGC